MPGDTDERRHAPATQRNRDPILAVLQEVLPETGLVLEVASGTGEHAVHFARAFPALTWQPSDPDPGARRSISAWIAAEGLQNVNAPLELDAASEEWPIDGASAMVCINMIHISPWEATEGLMRGAGRILGSGAPLYLYGPFRRAGHTLEPSNEAFDRDLRRKDPRWGLRDVDEVTDCAAACGLEHVRIVEMPANNLSLVFRRV
jgi:SAM-dependent methyltransferase